MAKKTTKVDPFTYFGYIFIVIGLLVLFEEVFEFQLFDSLVWPYAWPMIVVLLGFYLVGVKRK
jgi:hypothetical protein